MTNKAKFKLAWQMPCGQVAFANTDNGGVRWVVPKKDDKDDDFGTKMSFSMATELRNRMTARHDLEVVV